ncbi:glycosyltransferase [Vibrio furnissii]|uniref:glycosyltransferase n=1 Tax=Vibrio furnissii TaxID=29494 RepID=UPI001EEB4964|nr:glycosyltransferase [Vibrio furnissii]
MTNVLMLINSYSSGGAERVFINLANEFKYKCNVFYVVGCNKGPFLDGLHNDIPKYNLTTKMSTVHILLNSWKIIKILKRNKINVLFSTLDLSNLINIFWCGIFNLFTKDKIKIVVREANTLKDKDGHVVFQTFGHKCINYLLNKIAGNANLIICNSEDTLRDIVDIRNVHVDRTIVIPNPVISTTQVSNPKLKTLKYNTNTINLISIGRLNKQKNHEFLIRLVRFMLDEGGDIKLDIYGVGEEKLELTKLISSLHLENSVSLCGYEKEIAEKISNYDVFVLASKWEGFGNVIVEAMYMGLPVVISNCPGGPKQIVKSSLIGNLCELNYADFSSAIIEQYKTDSFEKINLRRSEGAKYTSTTIADKYYKAIKL